MKRNSYNNDYVGHFFQVMITLTNDERLDAIMII